MQIASKGSRVGAFIVDSLILMFCQGGLFCYYLYQKKAVSPVYNR